MPPSYFININPPSLCSVHSSKLWLFLYLYIQETYIPMRRTFILEFLAMEGICWGFFLVGINPSAKQFSHVSIHQIFDEWLWVSKKWLQHNLLQNLSIFDIQFYSLKTNSCDQKLLLQSQNLFSWDELVHGVTNGKSTKFTTTAAEHKH